MNGAIQIANDGKCASASKRIEGLVVLAAANTIQALTSDLSIYFQKLWVYPGKAIATGKLTANTTDVYVGNRALQLATGSVTGLIIKASTSERQFLLVTATAAAHGFSTNDTVTIAGATDAAFNGKFQVTVVDANTFTYTIADAPATMNPGGTITYSGLQAVAAANDVTPDLLQSSDLPLKYELPLGQRQQLATVIVQGAQADGVFYRIWA